MRYANLYGSSFEIGRQEGRQARSLRPLLVQVIAARLGDLRRLGADGPETLKPAKEALEALDRPLLDFLAGMAQELELSADDLLRYTLSSYLKDLHKVSRGPSQTPSDDLQDGCTAWAAAGAATLDGRPLLAKNRDYHSDHIPLQRLVRVRPVKGYRYLSIGSAGSPHVFSSGMNERGLAVADTHVLSRDIGPGLPRFSLMRELLQYHTTVRSALDYLRSVQHMGAGTLILADGAGYLAICESGYRHSGYLKADLGGRQPGQGVFLVSTNHFVTQQLAAQWVEDEPPMLRGNSPARRARVMRSLAEAAGRVDISWAQGMMTAHGSPQDAICRHPLQVAGSGRHPSLDSSTISSVLFLPAGPPGSPSPLPAVWLADGHPCQAQWQQHEASGGRM